LFFSNNYVVSWGAQMSSEGRISPAAEKRSSHLVMFLDSRQCSLQVQRRILKLDKINKKEASYVHKPNLAISNLYVRGTGY